MPIPVLFMVRQLGLGGSERQMTEMARSLDRSQFEPHVACFHANGFRSQELKDAGVPVVRLPIRSFASFGALQGARQLRDYVRTHRIGIVHSFDYPTNVFAMPIVRAFTSAIPVSSLRGAPELTPGIYRRLERSTYRMVKGVVVNCEFLRRRLVDDGVPPERVHVCYNGIDLAAFTAAGASERGGAVPEGVLTIGVVAALRQEKGLPTLLEAFARMRRTAAMRLIVVGSGSMSAPLRQQARELGIADDCIWQEGVADVRPWLRSIDIFVLPSLSEALSNSVMEAMACGCTVVASNVGGNPELVGEDRGILFEPADAGGLATALEQLAGDPGLRERLAATAAQFIQSLSLRRAARRMGEIYSQLAG